MLSEDTVSQVQTASMAILVVSMMVALGLETRLDDLSRAFDRRRQVLLAIFTNIVVMPALAFAFVAGLALPSLVATGLLLCAAAPGGPAAALYTVTAKSDTGYTALLTIVMPLIGLVTTPLTMALTLGTQGGSPFALVWPMARTLLIFQISPLVCAMWIAHARPELAARLARIAKPIANGLLAAIALALIVLKGEVLWTLSAPTWIALIGAPTIFAGLGYASGLPDVDVARSGALVATSRNVTSALLLAATYFADPVVDTTILCFALVVLLMPLGLALWWRRSASPTQARPTS